MILSLSHSQLNNHITLSIPFSSCIIPLRSPFYCLSVSCTVCVSHYPSIYSLSSAVLLPSHSLFYCLRLSLSLSLSLSYYLSLSLLFYYLLLCHYLPLILSFSAYLSLLLPLPPSHCSFFTLSILQSLPLSFLLFLPLLLLAPPSFALSLSLPWSSRFSFSVL